MPYYTKVNFDEALTDWQVRAGFKKFNFQHYPMVRKYIAALEEKASGQGPVKQVRELMAVSQLSRYLTWLSGAMMANTNG